jgi:orotate phosphoribosyltransferase
MSWGMSRYDRTSRPVTPAGRSLGSDAVTDRSEFLDQIRSKAVVHGAVTLSSGKQADWYVDLRRVLLDGPAARLAGRVMLDLAAGLTFDAVGGLTLGADPVATAMMHAATEQGRQLNAFIVRKEGKAHGMQRRIEGPDVTGQKVLAVEDTSTTGNSVLTAVDVLTAAGADVVGVAVVVDRGARHLVEERGLPYLAAYDLADLGLS